MLCGSTSLSFTYSAIQAAHFSSKCGSSLLREMIFIDKICQSCEFEFRGVSYDVEVNLSRSASMQGGCARIWSRSRMFNAHFPMWQFLDHFSVVRLLSSINLRSHIVVVYLHFCAPFERCMDFLGRKSATTAWAIQMDASNACIGYTVSCCYEMISCGINYQ